MSINVMRMLEIKVPPPAVVLVVAAAMWGISLLAPRLDLPQMARVIAALAIAIAGIAIAVAGAGAFRHARTTVSPVRPDNASSLVTTGVYRFTRNPMYVGMGLVLLAWAVFLAAPLALLGPIVFVVYIDRFQVKPEERALAKIFGVAYADYRRHVRRWL
jgi:protein-S-isoprenylcysteine O-methyltransferase Ste14